MHVWVRILLDAVYVLVYVAYAYCEAAFRVLLPRAPKSVRHLVVLVTGGAQGIGRHTAELLAARGARLVLWDIEKEVVMSAAEDIRRVTGAEVHPYMCDVSSYEQVTRAAGQVQREVGDVDILINNAGVMKVKPLPELSEQDVRHTWGVNIMAHFWTLKAFLPAMMSRNAGHIVTISSYAGLRGSPLMTDYTASKFAVRGLTEALESELREKSLTGIKLTTVYPLFTNTALVRNVMSHASVQIRFGRILELEEVAEAIVEGVLRNKREVYVPGIGTLLPFLIGVLPSKAMQAIVDFVDMRFVSTVDSS